MNKTEKILAEFDEKFTKVWSGLPLSQESFDKLKLFLTTSIAQAIAEERERVVGEIEKYNDEQKSTAIWSDEYRDGFDHAFGGIWELLSSLDKLTDK